MTDLTLTFLIRTSYRPELFARCLESIKNCGYMPREIIIAYDDDRALTYIPAGVESFRVNRTSESEFHYNLYCNELKARVRKGYFMYLDDDDFLLPNLSINLSGHGCIVQFLRGEWHRPTARQMQKGIIKKGQIGMPCIILHHALKDISHFDDQEDADFRFIESVLTQVSLPFVAIPIVGTDRRSKGVMQKNLVIN